MRKAIMARLALAAAAATMAVLVGGAAHADEPGADTDVQIVIDDGYACPDNR